MRLACVTTVFAAATAAHADPAALREFGRCTARVSELASVRLLATQPGSRAEGGSLTRLKDRSPACMGDDATNAPTVEVRGAVAEGLLAGKRGGSGLRAVSLDPIFALNAPGVSKRKHDLNEAIYGFGQCVVAAQPGAVRELVASAPTSLQEQQAFTTLRPALGPCLPSDAAMRLDRTTLRAVLAESLFMLTVGAAQ